MLPWYHSDGTMAGIRISKAARFDAPFTPPKPLDTVDDTPALQQFGEGKADLLIDSSGNGHHGKIEGAKWVKAESLSPVAGEPAKEASLPPPLKIAEPPPLDEWLKGREVLTVAQDGQARFKTIQAAL